MEAAPRRDRVHTGEIPMRSLIGASLLLVLAACSGSPLAEENGEPLEGAEGVADVVGQVLSASGSPIVGSVTISCGNGVSGKTVATDAQGHYHAALVASGTGRVPCEFTSAGILVDATIGFGPPGLPHALQIVNLRASS
jgi:hypothetical protein